MIGKALDWILGPIGSYVSIGVLLVAVGSAVTYHVVQVNAAYEQGAVAARERCARDAAAVKAKAETMFRLRANRLQAEIDKLRKQDSVEEIADETASKNLEEALAKMKADPECWSPAVIKGIQK